MTIIRFLNIDLDFFLDRTAHRPRSLVRRQSSKSFKPWSEQALRDFLETQCGLVKGQQIEGRFGTHHDAAFDYWHSLISASEPESQIELTHIDAHADLGMGDSSWLDIMENVLLLSVDLRVTPKRGPTCLNLGNYITYAAACRWIKSVVFVQNPSWAHDLPPFYFKNFDYKSGYMELKGFHPGRLQNESGTAFSRFPIMVPDMTEPCIPFTTVQCSSFLANASFDYAFLSHSPNYTPRSADKLIGVFSDYINFK